MVIIEGSDNTTDTEIAVSRYPWTIVQHSNYARRHG